MAWKLQESRMPNIQTQTLHRREALRGLAGLGVAACVATPLWAQGTKKKLAPKLKIVIPAIARSSLDDASRALGDALVVAGLCDEIDYENREAKGGSQAPTYFAEKYAQDPNALLIGDTSLAGAIALHKPAVELSRLTPVARLTTDYLVVVVPANSPIKSAADLGEKLKAAPRQTPVGIGSLGSVDHVLAGLLVKAAGAAPEEASYVPFMRSFELVDAVGSGKLAAAVSGWRTFSADVASGRLRAIGVASRRAAYGLRTLREQGQDVDLVNWRAVFTGAGVAAARQAEMVEAIRAAVAEDSWKKALKQSYWDAAWLAGADLASTLDIDIKTLQVAVQLLKLKA